MREEGSLEGGFASVMLCAAGIRALDSGFRRNDDGAGYSSMSFPFVPLPYPREGAP